MGHVISFPFTPASYQDRTSDLDGGDCVLLLALRSWTQSCRDAQDPRARTRDALGLAGAELATRPFEALMAAIGPTPEQPLKIRCLRCTRLSADEKDILCAASLVQSGEIRLAETVLRNALTSAESVALAVGALDTVCELFARVRLYLTWRRPSAAGLAIATAEQDSWSPFPTLQ
jgi:hypothetical protein